MKRVFLPLSEIDIKNLKSGEEILLSGTLYTARDIAHQRMIEAIKKGKKLPIPLKNQTLYYSGPTCKPPRKVIGSCGPTTSARMDIFTPQLLAKGLKAMIGKGNRSQDVIKAIKKYKAVYFIAIGGIGALLSKKVKRMRLIAYRDLGPEAIYKLEVKDFPVIVGIDAKGKNIYKR